MGRKSQPAPKIAVPLYIPTEDGFGELELGVGEMRGSTLLISFNDLIPAQAIARRISEGGIVGITFVIPADEAEEAKEIEDAIQASQDAVRAQAILEAETPEEAALREAEEEVQHKVDAALLEAELNRLEE